jgi:hypothetical protein
MLELVVSAVLLTTLLSMITPMVKWIGTTEEFSIERQAATEHLANVMEQVAALKPDGRELDAVTVLLNDGIGDLGLANVEAQAQVENQTNPTAVRIQLSLTWKADGTRKTNPIRLTAWFRGQAKP